MGSLCCCIVTCAHLGNCAGHWIATLTAPLLFTSGPVMYETVLHSCETSPVGWMGTDLWQCALIVLPHWNTRLLPPWPAIPLSHIILTLREPVLAYPNNAERQARERRVSILKSLSWFDHNSKMRGLDSNLRSSNSKFPYLPLWEVDALTHSATPTGLRPSYGTGVLFWEVTWCCLQCWCRCSSALLINPMSTNQDTYRVRPYGFWPRGSCL